jgi:hypothetical protein
VPAITPSSWGTPAHHAKPIGTEGGERIGAESPTGICIPAAHAQRGNVIAAGTGLIVLIKRWHRLDHGRIEHDELAAGR